MIVHHMLKELRVPHELRLVDIDTGAQKDPKYLRLNPNGQVPTLVVDGRPMYEAAAITLFLADRHRRRRAPRHVSQWMFHLANTLQPAFRLWFYAKDLPHVDHATVKADVQAYIEAVWDRVESHLVAANSSYMLGASVSALDLYLVMLMRWSRNMPKPATEWPRVASVAHRVKETTSWKNMNAAEGNTDWP
ncbi:hypothetical protein B5M09_003245 [Aphanomyces astaci]|uniref:GST N-terminal domain-containing protein n=1 Tax=Aphanomyces astaci TaxID=112090 RepID=A0A3R7ZBX6_APHAT|nr:hypothetical protein B5M09_003245 [Aphanomyces astaci]